MVAALAQTPRRVVAAKLDWKARVTRRRSINRAAVRRISVHEEPAILAIPKLAIPKLASALLRLVSVHASFCDPSEDSKCRWRPWSRPGERGARAAGCTAVLVGGRALIGHKWCHTDARTGRGIDWKSALRLYSSNTTCERTRVAYHAVTALRCSHTAGMH